MKVLDVELDTRPTAKKVADMAELRIRNLLCFKELQTFNDTGKWLGKHPLITHQSTCTRLDELYLLDYTAFMEQYSRCCANIERYKSFLKSEKRTQRRDTDNALLAKHIETKAIFESVIESRKL